LLIIYIKIEQALGLPPTWHKQAIFEQRGGFMKILQVCPRYYPYIGGVEEHVRNISELLSKKHEIVVCSTDPSAKLQQTERIQNVEVRRFPAFAPSESYFFSLPLKEYLTTHSKEFDLIHAHSYHAFPAFFAAISKDKRNFVFTPHYHGTGHTFIRSILHFPYRFWGKRIFSEAKRIICVSKSEKVLIEKDFPINENKISVIPNGINLEEFKQLTQKKKDHQIILTVCRLESYKGIQYLIEVLPELDSNVSLEIVGKGPYKNFLLREVKRLKLIQRVNFLQDLPRASLLQKYVDADVFALLSEHEAFGICIAESLCARTPCVVSNIQALKEWVDNKNCFGVNLPVNLSDLRSTINVAMKTRAQKISKILDWQEVASKITELYNELAG
jgi:glycosyltransferase involved in cell wall biosynthesis